MDIKYVLVIIVIGSCALVSMNAFNLVPYKPFTLFLALQIFSGPIAALVLLNKKHWLRALVAIIAFTGLSGLVSVSIELGSLLLFNSTLTYPQSTYLYHGAISLLFIATFVTWYYIRGRDENKNAF